MRHGSSVGDSRHFDARILNLKTDCGTLLDLLMAVKPGNYARKFKSTPC